MRHEAYLLRAQNIFDHYARKNVDSIFATADEKITILRLETKWSFTQCKNIVEELEGRRIYTPQPPKLRPLKITDENFFLKLLDPEDSISHFLRPIKKPNP